MGGATIADIYFATDVCLIKMFGCHSESHGMFIMAPKGEDPYSLRPLRYPDRDSVNQVLH